jgi:hypothetical protein
MHKNSKPVEVVNKSQATKKYTNADVNMEVIKNINKLLGYQERKFRFNR